MNRQAIAVLIGGMLFAPLLAAKQYVFPAKGQKPEVQAADEASCSQWAIQQSGYNPAAAAPAPAATTAPPARGGAVKGAAVAAGVAKISDNDASDAAGAGAAAGLVVQRSANRKAAQQQEEQVKATTADQDAKLKEFEKANAACLTGKGYTVQ